MRMGSRNLRAEALEPRMLMAADAAQLLAPPTSTAGPTEGNDGIPAFVAAPGDANLDGRFDQADILQVAQAGKYLTGESADWSEGDWNGDRVFDQLDLVAALSGENPFTPAYGARVVDVNRSEPHAFMPDVNGTFYPPTGEAHAQFRRGVDGFSYNIHTTGLPAGVYTNWIVGFPDPSKCSPADPDDPSSPPTCGPDDLGTGIGEFVFWTANDIVQENGVANFHAEASLGELPEGDGRVLIPGAWGDGTADPSTTEYHGIIRYHGPASEDADELFRQLYTFESDCEADRCFDAQAVLFVR